MNKSSWDCGDGHGSTYVEPCVECEEANAEERAIARAAALLVAEAEILLRSAGEGI
jgi:hypothetical protein